MTDRDDSALQELLWVSLYLVLAGAIVSTWTTGLPGWVLWSGYVAGAVAVVLVVRWFVRWIR